MFSKRKHNASCYVIHKRYICITNVYEVILLGKQATKPQNSNQLGLPFIFTN